jgi:hypothetical protein
MDRRLGGWPEPGFAEWDGTDHVRRCRRVRRKKWMNREMTDDVPGTVFPDPSLDDVPRALGPATRRLGVSRTADRARGRSIRRAGKPGAPHDPDWAR